MDFKFSCIQIKDEKYMHVQGLLFDIANKNSAYIRYLIFEIVVIS